MTARRLLRGEIGGDACEFSAIKPIEVTSERDLLLPNNACVTFVSTPEIFSQSKNGHILRSDALNMIFRCYTYWRSREPAIGVEDTCKFVAQMLDVSDDTVFKVRKEVKAASLSGSELPTPSQKRPRKAEKRRCSARFDSFALCTLRTCVHEFFHHSEIPMVEKLTNEYSKCMKLISLKWQTVRHVLAEIGFKYQMRSRNSVLIDEIDITEWWNRYLRDVERCREKCRKIFLDEA
ncbi:hypothetical protein MTO96_046707 [Rhipicephalus appendiculatus]